MQPAYLHNAADQHMYVAEHSLVAEVLTISIRMVRLALSLLTNSIALVDGYKVQQVEVGAARLSPQRIRPMYFCLCQKSRGSYEVTV
jgi:hypothetical protein